MSLRRCDRYLLRQMLGPFLLALAGLALFILLNLILRLSELMVDRGIGLTQLLRLLIFWMPELIAWAIPMAALFAVFLGLGRLEHDREIMALESIGVSLRRILLPLLIAAVGLSFLTFAVYNWAMPASKQAAQRTYREILFSQSVPRISANTFFTGPNDQYFYVRQYDADDGSVHDVLIYDVTGRLFPQAESQITMVTADSGTWSGENWELSAGRIYGFNREGTLIYSGTFEEMSIPVAQTADQIWSQSKSPSEMGIRELASRIGQARASGLPINGYIVELHQRVIRGDRFMVEDIQPGPGNGTLLKDIDKGLLVHETGPGRVYEVSRRFHRCKLRSPYQPPVFRRETSVNRDEVRITHQGREIDGLGT